MKNTLKHEMKRRCFEYLWRFGFSDNRKTWKQRVRDMRKRRLLIEKEIAQYELLIKNDNI